MLHRLRPMLTRIRSYRPWLWTFVVIIIVNLVLLSAYVWSRGGQVTTIRVEIRGSEFTVSVDGHERFREDMPAPAQGGILVFPVNPRVDPPTLASAGRVESVRVTSLETGEILYETREIAEPPLSANRGDVPILDLRNRPWRDYAVEVKYRQLIEANFHVRSDGQNEVAVSLQRSSLAAISLTASLPAADGQAQIVGRNLEASSTESAKSATAAVLKAYPVALAIATICTVTAFLAMRFGASATFSLDVAKLSPHTTLAIAGVISACTALLVAFLLRFYMDGLAYVADEGSYLYQAKLLASGRTHVAAPAVPEAFSFSYTPFIIDNDGRWASFYPFGHPLALSLGAVVGAPWLVPPLLAGVNVLLMYAIARLMYGAWTGVLAAALVATSPFILMQASSYMSHTTAIAYLLTCVLACLLSWRRPVLAGVVAGIAFGLLFNTRPLTAMMFLPALTALVCARWLPRGRRSSQTMFLGAFACAAIALFGAYLAYNWSITGDPLDNGYAASGDLSTAFGFAKGHSVAGGISNEVTNVISLLLVLNGWPAWIGIALVLLPFMLGTRNLYDWFLIAAAVSIIAGAALFFTTGFFYGPRYVFEAVPLLLLLTARGFSMLVATPRRIAPLMGVPDVMCTGPTGWFRVVVGAAAVALVCASAATWILAPASKSEGFGTPQSARGMKSGRTLDDRLLVEARRADIHDALIIVNKCGFLRFCYLSVFQENDIGLDGDVVWAYDVGDDNAKLLAEYPCRNLFYADYERRTITSAGTTSPPPGERCG